MKDWILELARLARQEKLRRGRLIICLRCGQKREHRALGLCRTCYEKNNYCINCGKFICNSSIRCGSCAKKKKLNPMWKDEKSDYRIVLVDYKGKPTLEHRLMMAQAIGRPLEPEEVVHHIDGDPSNNVRENLMLFANNSKHMKHHHKLRKIGG